MRNFLLLLTLAAAPALAQSPRPRARDIGLVIGSLPPGPLNAITDVAGVRVGQTTVTRGDSVNTGITAILPHGGNPFREKVPAAIVVGNGFGKLAGSTQVNELGELESPIVLTCTLCVPRAADAVLTWLLGLPGNEDVRSANPVVGETNDGYLNNIRARPIAEADVLGAIKGAVGGPVEEGAVGAGRMRPSTTSASSASRAARSPGWPERGARSRTAAATTSSRSRPTAASSTAASPTALSRLSRTMECPRYSRLLSNPRKKRSIIPYCARRRCGAFVGSCVHCPSTPRSRSSNDTEPFGHE